MRYVLIKPLITELSMKDAGRGIFTFLVLPQATKTEVKNAVQSLFPVQVTHISTVNINRVKTVMTKFGRKKTKEKIKKARITLKKGQMIPAFEVKEEGKKEEKKEKGKS